MFKIYFVFCRIFLITFQMGLCFQDQKVSWHATPFEERLEKALSEESIISQRYDFEYSFVLVPRGSLLELWFNSFPFFLEGIKPVLIYS